MQELSHPKELTLLEENGICRFIVMKEATHSCSKSAYLAFPPPVINVSSAEFVCCLSTVFAKGAFWMMFFELKTISAKVPSALLRP
jgi:hypothetical protein